jgi:hypothetical protein
MVPKKAPRTISSGRGYQQELEYLYARRTAIDMLIRSLQEYDLSHMKWMDFEKRQTA